LTIVVYAAGFLGTANSTRGPIALLANQLGEFVPSIAIPVHHVFSERAALESSLIMDAGLLNLMGACRTGLIAS